MPVLPTAQRAVEPPSRWVGILTFLIPTGVLFTIGWITWQPIPVGVWHDDGAYLLIAESLSGGGGLSWFGVSGTPPAAKFPPLFPALLALVLRTGVDPESGAAVFAVFNSFLLATSGGLFALFARRTAGLNALWAGGLATLVWLSPRLWALAALPLSEPLFMVALMGALLASTRVEPPAGGSTGTVQDKGTTRVLPGLDFVVAFAAAFYARTIGLVIAPALVAACLVRGVRVKAAWVGGGCLAVVLPWFFWSSAASERVPAALRDVLGSYGGWLIAEVARNPVTFLASAVSSGWSSWLTLSAMVLPGPAGSPVFRLTVGVGLAVAVVFGGLRMARSSLTAVFTMVFYLAIVAVWPFQATRLIAPIFPLVALALFLACRDGNPQEPTVTLDEPRRHVPRDWTRRLVTLVAVLVAVNYGARSLHDLMSGNHLRAYQIRAEALAAAVQSVHDFTSPDAVIGAPELWAGIQIHANRVVAPSARFLPLATDGPSWGTPEQQFELWEEAQLDYIVVEHAGGVHGAALDQLDAECPGGAVQLVATLPTGFLVRLAWDEECRRRVLP